MTDDSTRMLNRIGEALDAAGIHEDSYAECVAILARQRDEKAEYLNRLRVETVGALTKAGICMLVDADPTAPGEVRRAVQRLAAERDEAMAEATKALARNAQLCNALECVLDLNRVRDARSEPPPLNDRVLVWQGVYWAPACSLVAGKWNIEWRSGFPLESFPFWLPMPPTQEAR